jgi:hypothetical protein
MGKHAQSRQPSRARRAAVVSTGTLLLCLGTAAPAFADLGPVPVPEPIGDAADQVSEATGLPNPLETADATADELTGTSTGGTDKNGHHARHKHRDGTKLTTSTLGTTDTTSSDGANARQHRQQASAVTPASYTYGGLRGVPLTTASPLVDAGRAPMTAGALPQAPDVAADASPTLITPAANVLTGTGGEEGPRVLLVGLAAMVLGGLSAGHIKVAQDRIAQVIG